MATPGKGSIIGYWLLTGLICLSQAASGVMDLSGKEELVEIFNGLGYPLYLMTILGCWKIAGAIALAVPGKARLKEWAYAGFFFDFTGAAASHIFSGHEPGQIAPPLVLAAILMGSYFLRPASRRLA